MVRDSGCCGALAGGLGEPARGWDLVRVGNTRALLCWGCSAGAQDRLESAKGVCVCVSLGKRPPWCEGVRAAGWLVSREVPCQRAGVTSALSSFLAPVVGHSVRHQQRAGALALVLCREVLAVLASQLRCRQGWSISLILQMRKQSPREIW